MAFLVKICGSTTAADAEAAARFGCTAIGFNFYEKSPRCISIDKAKGLISSLPSEILRVGVFVNHSRDEVAEIARETGLQALQFSGDEDLSFCKGWDSYRVIKAVRLGGTTCTAAQILEISQQVDTVLFDAFSQESFGGTGEEIPDEIIKQSPFPEILRSAILSGGLRPSNVRQKIQLYRPAGVDVASGVESSPGVKDQSKMQAFITAALQAHDPTP